MSRIIITTSPPTRSTPPSPTLAEDFPLQTVSLEWIRVGDKDARRKARSHVTREFKQRQRVEALRFQKAKESSRRPLASAKLKASLTHQQQQPEDEDLSILDEPSRRLWTSPRIVLEGMFDPFNQLPVNLNSTKDLGLVDHYFTTFSPKPFLVSNCDYSPFRNLTLRVGIQDAASFLLIISGSANDIALRSDKSESQQSIEYRVRAMTMINARMALPQLFTSNGAISACTVLAGLELLWGTPETFNIHMNGLEQMLKLRGGYDNVQRSNPALASLIAWHDYAGVAALASRRRFEFTSCDNRVTSAFSKPLRFTTPLNVPQETLPPNYTLYDDLMILIDGLENATSLICLYSMDKSELQQYTSFVARLNSDLIRILTKSSKRTTPFRRFLIEDSFRIACLIYISAICKSYDDWDVQSDLVVQKLKNSSLCISGDWGHSIEMILRLLMSGGKARSQKTIHYAVQLLEYFVLLTWSDWKAIRDALLDYFLVSDLCSGPHQDLWLCRIGN